MDSVNSDTYEHNQETGFLKCDFGKMAALNLVNFNHIVTLICQYNDIDFFPYLPNQLVNLHCSNNKLKKINNLPKTIKTLVCSS